MRKFKKLSYGPAKWSPVTVLTRQPMVLGARKSLPANTVRELIVLAKASPGKVTSGLLATARYLI